MSSDGHQALAESFVFLEPSERPERRRNTRRRNKARHSSPLSQQLPRSSLATNQEELPDPICTAQVANLLQGVVIFIDKNLSLDTQLGTIATNLGASRSESLDSKVTHVIHGPSPYANAAPNSNKQRIPRLVNQALDRGIRVVSPSWIYECYEKRRRLPEMYYPFDMDSTCRLDYNAASTSRSHDDDNVFELPEEELVSSSDEENDHPIRVAREQQQQQQEALSDTEERDDMYGTPYEPSITAATASSSNQQNDQEYHGGPELVSSSEEEARLERRKKRMAEIAKIKAAKKRQRDQADGEEDEDEAPLMYDAAEGGNALLAGTDRLEIWYGEQSFYHDYNPPTTSTRRSTRTLSKSAKRSK